MQNSGFQVQHKCGYHSGEKMNSVPISEGLKKKKKNVCGKDSLPFVWQLFS